ncbi:hypothetical protein P7C70_g6339, partial [Phenoliferia sp. Uapishka_3]
MATIHSLAPDTILSILFNLVPSTSHVQYRASPVTGNCSPLQSSHLLATSLVCKAFRAPSQELLSQYLDFTHPTHKHRGQIDGEYFREQQRTHCLEKWLNGVLKPYRAKRLWIIVSFATEVLDRLAALDELEISGRVQGPWEHDQDHEWFMGANGFRNEPGWELLSHPALINLKRLSIQASGSARKHPHNIPRLKFSLEQLTLRTPGNPPAELLDALFAPLCSSNLRSLSFTFLKPGNVSPWTPSNIPDLRHLTHLSLSLAHPIPPSISTLLRFCTAITVITLQNFLTPTSERLSEIGQSLSFPATVTTLRLIEGEDLLREGAPLEEQCFELEKLLGLPVMEKVQWICAPAVDLHKQWAQGMKLAPFFGGSEDGEPAIPDWKKWLSCLVDWDESC